MTEELKPARPEDIPCAVSENTMNLLGVEVRCYVLDDGRQLINAEDFHKLMRVMAGEPLMEKFGVLSTECDGPMGVDDE